MKKRCVTREYESKEHTCNRGGQANMSGTNREHQGVDPHSQLLDKLLIERRHIVEGYQQRSME